MTRDEVVSFLYENVNGFLATVDDGKPRVRGFQFMMEENGKFYFATSKNKAVASQLHKTPYVEFACSTPDFSKNLRISGEIQFADDAALTERLFDTFDFLKKLYSTPENPDFELFYIEKGEANYWDYVNKEPVIIGI